MKLSRNIGFPLTLGFGLLVIAILINTVISSRTVDRITRSWQEVSGTLDPSLRSLNDLREIVELAGDLAQARPPAMSVIVSLVQEDLPGADRELKRLYPGWRQQDREIYDDLSAYISDSLVAQVTEYSLQYGITSGSPAPGSAQLAKLARTCEHAADLISGLTGRIEQKATEANRQALSDYRRGRNILLTTGMTLALAALAIAFILSRSLVLRIRQYRNVISSMAKGNLPDEKLREGQDEMGRIGSALNSLIKGLKNLFNFSEEIGKGNFSGDFKPLSEDDVLGNSLIRLREDLKNAAIEDEKRQKEDERRNWSNQGIARFSEILREHSGKPEDLTGHVISDLVKYMGALVGGIFLIRKNKKGEDEIDLVASYAYNRKKHLQKKISPGEGLVGRCVQEGSTIFMTDIPPDYIKIKSGLGEDNPRSLLIVPLKFNEAIIGVVEIASLEVFEDYQIEFIERIGTSIASSLAARQAETS